MRLRTGLVALCFVALAAPAATLAAESQSPACAAALDLVLSAAKRGRHSAPLIVTAAPDMRESTAYATADALAQADWGGPPPSQALADAFLSLPAQSALDSCPGLTAELARAKIRTGDDAAARVTATDSDIVSLPTYGADVLSLSLPIVSADGHDALAQDRLCAGPDACAGAVVHLQRQKGERWRVVAELQSAS